METKVREIYRLTPIKATLSLLAVPSLFASVTVARPSLLKIFLTDVEIGMRRYRILEEILGCGAWY